MKKYNEEYFSVYHKRTGKKIADCGSREDARMLVYMDWQNREYRVNKALMSPVIDIEIPKALPTTSIVATNIQENGCAPRKEQLSDAGPIRLPESQAVPLNTK